MIWDFLVNNKDAIEAIATIISAIIAVGGVIWGALKFLQARRIRREVGVFELITDKEKILPKLLGTENDDTPFADHKIPYQNRNPSEDLHTKLKRELNISRYLLITAPTGYGKTREAGMLAKRMMEEGWQVIRVLDTGWLDVPKDPLTSGRVKVLLLLDDLNNLFRKARGQQDPKAETSQIPTFKAPTFYARLLDVLNWFEQIHDADDFCVLATARDEEEYLQSLGYNEDDKLWKRFKRVKITEPSIHTVVEMMKTAKAEGLQGKEDEFETIARRNDGSIRNLVLNLQRWHRENKSIAADNFLENQGKSWNDKFAEVEKKLKNQPVKFIYLAVFLLRYFQVPLVPRFITSLAARLAFSTTWQRFVHRNQIRKTFNYLTRKENLLTPRDGQLEGCPLVQNTDPQDYLEKVLEVLLFSGYFYTQEVAYAVFGLIDFISQSKSKRVSALYRLLYILYFRAELKAMYVSAGKEIKIIEILNKKRNKNILTFIALSELHSKQGANAQSIALLEKEIKANPQSWALYSEIGIKYRESERYEEAESSYRKSIELNPLNAGAHYNLGILLEKLERYEEAESSYRESIKFNPLHASAYSHLGDLLKKLKRYEEAVIACQKSIEIDPSKAHVYSALGNLFHDLKRYAEAETSYNKSIELDPKEAYLHTVLGNLLREQERYAEAEASYRKAIEVDASYVYAYSVLGNLLFDLKRYEEAESSYRKAIEVNPSYAHAYSDLGDLQRQLKCYKEAEASYRSAIVVNPSFTYVYSHLGNLLFDLKRYEEAEASYRKAIEVNPSYSYAYSDLGNLQRHLKRHEEAEASYRKAIELNPSYATAYNNLAIILRITGREKEALLLLEKMIEIAPENLNSYLGIASIKRMLGEAIEAGLVEKAHQFMLADDFYNRACIESVCDNIDLSFEYLQKAAQQERFNPVWAWEDPDLQWIRGDPRFEQIVGKKPS